MDKLNKLAGLVNLPLSLNQKRLWILYEQNKNNPAYNVQFTYYIKGEINYDVLNKSLEHLLYRHHTMFSVFKQSDGVPHIDIVPRTSCVEFVDFSDRPHASRRDKILSFAGQEIRKCFDIEKGPLYRFYLIKEENESFFFHAVIHHLIFDGYSLKLFLPELSKIYTNLIQGVNEKLEPLTYQSYDFALNEEKSELGKDQKQLSDFWREYLNGCSSELKFPFDYPRKSSMTGLGQREKLIISESATSKLKEISKREGSSLFKTMLNILGLLMQKYTGENDICIGFPVANRTSDPHLGEIFGFFINTSLARIQIDGEKSFRQNLCYTKDAAKKAIAKSKLSFDKIIEAVNPVRRSNQNPLFQVSLSWVSNMIIPLDLNGNIGEWVSVPEGVSPMDLTFYLWEKGECIEGEIECASDLISRESLMAIKKNFLYLINILVENPDTPVKSLPMISSDDLMMITEVNRTHSDYPRNKTVSQIFDEHVLINPDKIAVVFKNDSLTYKGLNEKANSLARTLAAAGVKSDIPVGVFMDKSVNIIVALLGILKAGGAYLPIDPEYPDQRIDFIIKESNCKVILTQTEYMNVAMSGVRKLDLNSSDAYADDCSDINNINKPSDLAYIIYTSGTTGTPKGSCIPHRGLIRLVCNTNYMAVTPEDRCLLAGAIIFDASIIEIWAPLLNGGTLFIIDKETLLNPKELDEVLDKNEITICVLTTPLFAQIAEYRADIFRKLKTLIVGGDVLSAPHANKVRKENPGLSLVNGYGPTENSCLSTYYKVDRDFDYNIPIGKPACNTTVYIFDKYMNYQPVGIIGELYVGGDGLARGYLNREELNKSCFIEHPFLPGERLYKTGDYARWLHDGNIEFHGRMDNQIKISGYRVELGEIESAIFEFSGIKNCAVNILGYGTSNPQIVGYIVPQIRNESFIGDLKTFLSKRLPGYMIPAHFLMLEELPLTPSGKIDRKKLVFDINELGKRDRENLKTLTDTQKIILKIWCEVLKISDVSVTDSFFDIGGNSLLVFRLINNIKEHFGFELSFKELLSHPTISESGNYIDNNIKDYTKKIELTHLTETVSLPLTRNQKRLWLISKLQPDLPSYIISVSYKLVGSLNREVFQESLEILFLRHHIVFSVIKEINSEPFCNIIPSKVDISYIDYSQLPEDEREKKVRDIIKSDSEKAFDLNNGPLYRLYLLMTGTDEYYFHLSIHHIVFDGWSWSVLAKDLSLIYNSLSGGIEVDLEKIEFQQYDYANWEEKSSGSQDENELIEFWKEYLKGASPVLNFPYDFQRRERPSNKGRFEPICLSQVISEKLRSISKTEDASLFTTMMSVFGIQLNKYTGEDDINLGLPVAYRPHSKLENIFGMFVNTVVVRLKYGKDYTFRKIIHETNESALNAITHQELTFEKIVEIVNPDRSSNVNPLFQAAFSWQNSLDMPLELNGIRSERIPLKEGPIPFDILFSVFDNGTTIEGEIGYSEELLKQETIIRFRDNFINLVTNLVENPELRISSIPMMSDEERKKILSFTDTRTNFPKDKTIIELFEDQVKLHPDKKAIVFKESFLTYKELNEKANQLARTLRNLGVTRNTPVAIIADKSLETIVGLVGILKAGGAYVPIDPDYPEQRMNFMIRDSGSRILVSQDKYMHLNIEIEGKVSLNSPGTYNSENTDIENINSSSDLAHILYTSGTTGVPKGTLIPQKGVVRLVRNTNYIEFTSEDRILQAGAIVFDASTFEIWGALLNGGTLYLVEKETILNPPKFGETLVKNEITTLLLTSSLLTQLADSGTGIFSKLKYLLVGGDVMSPSHIKKVRNEYPQLIVINAYGPTENSCISTYYKVDRDFDINIPIGKPISNSTAYIFDKNLNFQPIGLIGELYVGGDGLSIGYLNREDLNRTNFINHPHIPGEKIYKTGDYARWLPDGNIEFHGRGDNQLKIRGFRVELEEIESAISKLDGVIDTVVKPVKVEEGDYRLIAFLNVSETFNRDSKEIVKLLHTTLPSYMIPSAWKFMNSFPKNVNGKTDRKAEVFNIKDFETIARNEEEENLKALTPTQKIIAEIWSEVLKTSHISAKDSFFEVGGNSLLAIRLINIIKEKGGFTIAFKELLTYPSVIQLSNYIDSLHPDNLKAVKLVHTTEMANLPLTRNQKRLWLISKMQPDIPSYNILFAQKLFGPLNREIFQKSLEILFRRHHTVFSLIGEIKGEPYCDIVPSELEISFISFSGMPENEKRVNDIIASEAVRRFDLKKGPLFRIHLIMTAVDEYVLLINIHHIIFDGWSWSVFVTDLNEIYHSLIKGKEIDLEKIEFQQYDYANWENSPENLKAEKEIAEFWKENLMGASPVLNFPYDFKRMEQPSNRGKYETITLSEDLSEKLRRISKAENSSLFTTMMSVFGIQMHKYSGEDDINIGVPVAYRPHSKLENIFGMFVNTVVVRLRYQKGLTFRNIIRQTDEAAFNAISHQGLTFDKVVEIVNPKRSSNVNPLAQVAFAWQNDLDMPLKLDGMRSEKMQLKEGTIPFDILFSLWENGRIIEGEIGYSTDILKPETIIRLKNCFLNLANELVENSDTAVDSVPMISEDEKLMIETVNQTYADFSKDKSILSLFEESAVLQPEKIAIISDEGELTYSELNTKADQLAEVLRTYNIGTGDFVGLLLNRSPQLIICLLALFKTGAAYVPLNLTDPDNRIFSIIEAASIKFVITHTGNRIELKSDQVKLYIEQLINKSVDFQGTIQDTVINSSDPAYIIFTSGTTGVPKGVLVNHRSVINIIEWVNKTFKISFKDKLLWTTNLSFDLSVYDIFGILAAGAAIRIVSEEDRLNPKKQYEILLNEAITFWDSAPQSLQQLTPFFNNTGNDSLFNSLRLVFFSGDWIPLSLPSIVTSNFPSAVVVGLGGATEATIWSNYFIVGNLNPEWKSIPYGKPIQNSRYYILDERMNHCRINQPGNLYIGGECLALGYFNDPVLTDSKFIPDPYNIGSKLYLTGDKAQWMPDGNIEFLGREDEQIKVRGYRVEMGEIKNEALKNATVRDAIVLPDKSDRHNIKVVLFITAFNNTTLEVKDLKQELRRGLPEYMIPADIIQFTEFPVTANGKVDTKALLAEYFRSIDSRKEKSKAIAGEDSEFLTPTQKIVHKIWCETLNAADISPLDNFFDIGGNSLLVFRLINNIKEHFGFELSFKELLSHPTISESGNYIDNNIKDRTRKIELTHLTETVSLPLTRNQKRLWLISKLQPDLPLYIISFSYKLVGSLNREVFQESLEILFRRHHIVFSVIKEVNSEPVCDIIPSKVDISYIDYSQLPEDEREKNVRDIIKSDSEKAFDLNNGPLYRSYLLMTGTDEYYFHLSIHHIVFDGWSWSVLAKDLSLIYNSLSAGIEVDLAKIEFQQYDYANWEEKSSGSQHENELIEFWKEYLKGASPVLNFPYDFQRRERPSNKGRFEPISLSQGISEKLRNLSKAEDASLFTTMMSVFGIQLNKYTGEDDINLGLPVAYRPHSKLENIFGMFVNTVVVRLRYGKDYTFRKIIHETNESALNAITHQELTFEKIVEIVNPDRSSNVNPLFQAAFSWQNSLDMPLELNGIRSERIPLKEGPIPFDILFSVFDNGTTIEGEIGYSEELLKQETIIRFRDNFINLVTNLVENPELRISSIPMMSDEERKKILRFTDTRTNFPKDKTIIELFEDQVNLYPEKTALVFKENTLSYKQLNERANQLARTLRKHGVGENEPVAILADKSLDIIVGILGILKAGGGYVPIDPEYPEQRITFILKDSGCRILLTQDKYIHIPVKGVNKLNLNSPSSYSTVRSHLKRINDSSSLAYIMYTSGTTGKPKGSMILQYSVIRLVRDTNYIRLTPSDRILLTGAMVFDATTFEIWGALLNGGCLYMCENSTILDHRALGEALKKNEITVLWLTSSLFTHIAELGTDIFSKLNYLLVGGDVLSVSHINKVRTDNPGLKVINGYGPTENTTFSTTFLIDRNYENNIPIGKPISNSTAYIFDRYMNYQPIGIMGELYVGGDGLSKGYLNREELNKLSFIEHPYIPGERIYKTGDYARWLPDGNIEFRGRIDNQLKIRGFRVELGEIESAISEVEGIIEVVIKPLKISEGDMRLAAFLNVSDTFSIDTKELSRQLKEKLPPFMIPSAFKIMHGFPKTINGKIDRDALVLEISEIAERNIQHLKTLTETEKKILEIWCDVLKTKDIFTTDNFFEIGGNSLLAISIMSKIESVFNIDLGLRVFFDSPKIKDLSETVDIEVNSLLNSIAHNSNEKTDSNIISGEL